MFQVSNKWAFVHENRIACVRLVRVDYDNESVKTDYATVWCVVARTENLSTIGFISRKGLSIHLPSFSSSSRHL